MLERGQKLLGQKRGTFTNSTHTVRTLISRMAIVYGSTVLSESDLAVTLRSTSCSCGAGVGSRR